MAGFNFIWRTHFFGEAKWKNIRLLLHLLGGALQGHCQLTWKRSPPHPHFKMKNGSSIRSSKQMILQIWDISDQRDKMWSKQAVWLKLFIFLSPRKRESRRLIADVAEMFFQLLLGQDKKGRSSGLWWHLWKSQASRCGELFFYSLTFNLWRWHLCKSIKCPRRFSPPRKNTSSTDLRLVYVRLDIFTDRQEWEQSTLVLYSEYTWSIFNMSRVRFGYCIHIHIQYVIVYDQTCCSVFFAVTKVVFEMPDVGIYSSVQWWSWYFGKQERNLNFGLFLWVQHKC